MDAEKFSDDFKLLCRFLKEAKLYRHFREYQYDYMKSGKIRNVVPYNSKDIMDDFGRTEFTYWLNSKKKIYPINNIYELLRAWIRAFYPERLCERLPYVTYEVKGYTIDKKKRKIDIKYKSPHY